MARTRRPQRPTTRRNSQVMHQPGRRSTRGATSIHITPCPKRPHGLNTRSSKPLQILQSNRAHVWQQRRLRTAGCSRGTCTRIHGYFYVASPRPQPMPALKPKVRPTWLIYRNVTQTASRFPRSWFKQSPFPPFLVSLRRTRTNGVLLDGHARPLERIRFALLQNTSLPTSNHAYQN